MKALKPTQDGKTDLPVIGVETVKRAAQVGLAGIAVEARKSLIINRRGVIEEADKAGLFVVGVAPLAIPSDMTDGALPAKPLTLMLVCGEPSGDQLGGELMAGLKALAGDHIRIVGVGGTAMAAQGLQSLFPLDDTAVMGLREVVPRIPRILRRVREASDFALASRPDAVVLIDSPDFTHRIARRLKRQIRHLRTVNYVAPQVWASRQYRCAQDGTLFRSRTGAAAFRSSVLRSPGVHAAFVGHPVIERAARMTGGEALRTRLGISSNAPRTCRASGQPHERSAPVAGAVSRCGGASGTDISGSGLPVADGAACGSRRARGNRGLARAAAHSRGRCGRSSRLSTRPMPHSPRLEP